MASSILVICCRSARYSVLDLRVWRSGCFRKKCHDVEGKPLEDARLFAVVRPLTLGRCHERPKLFPFHAFKRAYAKERSPITTSTLMEGSGGSALEFYEIHFFGVQPLRSERSICWVSLFALERKNSSTP